MVSFVVATRIEETGPRRYAVRVSALPLGELHCAPEELVIVCDNRGDANRAGERLALALAARIRARGNRVVGRGGEPCNPGAAEPRGRAFL